MLAEEGNVKPITALFGKRYETSGPDAHQCIGLLHTQEYAQAKNDTPLTVTAIDMYYSTDMRSKRLGSLRNQCRPNTNCSPTSTDVAWITTTSAEPNNKKPGNPVDSYVINTI